MRYITIFIFFIFISCTQNNPTPSTSSTSDVTKVKQFTKVPAEKAGIDFKNSLIESLDYNYYKFQYLYNGGGVAVGDINNDGLQDLYFTATMFSNRLYLNKGDLTFEDITEIAAVATASGTKTGVTMVDINHDGYLDIYVCRTGKEDQKETRANLFYINNGDPDGSGQVTFTDKAKEMGLGEYCFSNHANFFDYDNDGDLDLYLLNHPTNFKKESRPRLQMVNGKLQRITTPDNEYESDRLYQNNGDGTFTDVSKQAGVVNRAFGLSVSVTDINRDGWMDIFVANDYDEPDILYINQKNGTFVDESDSYFRHTSQSSMGADFGDINNDGLQDLMVLDMLPEDNRRQKLLMSKMIYDRVEYYANNGFTYQYMRNVLQLNNGNGTFSDICEFAGMAATDWSWGSLLADYNNDGWKDVYISNGFRRDVTNLDFLKFTKANFQASGEAVPIYDMLDQIPSEKVPNYMYQNKGNLSFADVTYNWGLTEPTHSNGSAYADLDNDGDLDLIVNNIDEAVSIFKNNGEQLDGQHYLQLTLEGNTQNPNGIGAAVTIASNGNTQYQEMTPTHGYFSSMPYLLHFGVGTATSIDKLTITWQDGKSQTLENVAADQRLILKYSDAQSTSPATLTSPSPIFTQKDVGIDFQHQENNFVDFKREPLLPHKISKEGPALASADVNGDGLTDIYIGGGAGQSSELYLQTASSNFKKSTNQPWQAHANKEDTDALFFDADGDGDQDLYVVSGGNAFAENDDRYADRLYLNDGKGNFTNATGLPKMTVSNGAVAAGDYDGDGDMDLFIGGRVTPGRYPFAPRSYILKNDSKGKFSDVTSQLIPDLLNIGMVTDAQWQDTDGDGQLDLIVVGEWMPITIFKFKEGKMTSKSAIPNSEGWWNSVHLADMDGDGDIDLLGGNMGLNARLKASTAQPVQVYAKDFDNNGAVDAILTRYIKGVSYPVASRDMILGQIKSLQKKFTAYAPFSSATINDIFTAAELNDALILKANTFANTYFENTNNGFVAKPLPTMAQLSPVKDFITADFNGDAQLDILLVGNQYDIDVESGRHDAGNGLLLLNQNGNFEALTIQESGFFNPQDARNMVQLSLANGNTLVIVVNNENNVNTFELSNKVQ